MSKRIAAVLTVVLAATVLASAARAGDICFTDNQEFTLVAKSFKLPSRNKCAPWQGEVYSFSLHSMEPWIITGAACTNSGGDTLHVGFSYYAFGAGYQFGHMTIPLPAKSGGNAYYSSADNPDGESEFDGSVAIVPCEPLIIPLK